MMLDLSIIATAVPWITKEFESLLDVGWYGSSYQLASASLQPLTGKMYTYFRTKWTFFTFFFIFELGSLLCGIAQSSKMLIVARAVAGLGAAGLMNGGLTIVAACLPNHKRPSAMGLMIAIGQLGQACGPLIGGAFTEKVSWRWCFYINLPIGGLIIALIGFIYIPERTTKPPFRSILTTLVTTLDLPGFVIFAPAAIMFFLALQYGGNKYAWDSATVISLFVGSGLTFILFMCWEYRKGEEAMIPFSMLRQRIVWASCATMFFLIGVLSCAAYYLPIYFQAVLGASPIRSGVLYLPNILLHITMSMTSGILVQRLGYYLPWVVSGSAISATAYGLLSMLTPTYPAAKRIGYQILAGFGCGCAATMPFIATQSLISTPRIPVAMGILIFCQNFGGATFLTLAETDFSQSLKVALKKYAPGSDASAIISLGATGFRDVVNKEELPGILEAYSEACDNIFLLVCGLSAGAFLCAWGMGWGDVRKGKKGMVEGREQGTAENRANGETTTV
ncbi:putative MFS transporter [Saccharata proteae CBS 121410]|uniref:MFS transporter n=1 Tax=Saccharata proteae CBS 121410 TaxID=1314787 RepID=A0A9P4LWH7_9PEZI|nr:putative MFS transporter [Saccharata proteae CBS 121410]